MPNSKNYVRNYKRVAEWEKEKYICFRGNLDKPSGEALYRILEQRYSTLVAWLREKIQEDSPIPLSTSATAPINNNARSFKPKVAKGEEEQGEKCIHRIQSRLDKKYGEVLQQIIERRGITFMTWLREKIHADDPAPPNVSQEMPRTYKRKPK